MLSPRLTNCKECANIPDLLRKIDCKLAELGNNLYNNVVFMLNRPIAVSQISELLVYKRVLTFRYCDTHYASGCPEVSTEDIASKVIRLTAGCVSLCNEPTVCEITTCAIIPCPNPTTTTTSTSSTSTTTTTSTTATPTTTTTTTITPDCRIEGCFDIIASTTTTTSTSSTSSTTTTSTTVVPFDCAEPFNLSSPEAFPNAITGNGTKVLSNGVLLTTSYTPNTFNQPPIYVAGVPGTTEVCNGAYVTAQSGGQGTLSMRGGSTIVMDFNPPINAIAFVTQGYGSSQNPSAQETVVITSTDVIVATELTACGDYATTQISQNEINLTGSQALYPTYSAGVTAISPISGGISQLQITINPPADELAGIGFDFYVCPGSSPITTTTTSTSSTTTTTTSSSTSTTTSTTTLVPTTTTTTTVTPTTTTTTTTLAPLVGCLEFDYLTLVTSSLWYTDPPYPVGVNTPSLGVGVPFNTGATTNTTSYTNWSQVPNTNYDVVFNIGGVDYTAVYQFNATAAGAVTVPYGKFNTNISDLAAMSTFQFSKIDANGNDLSSILSTFDHTTGDGIKVTAYGDCTTPTTTTTTTVAPTTTTTTTLPVFLCSNPLLTVSLPDGVVGDPLNGSVVYDGLNLAITSYSYSGGSTTVYIAGTVSYTLVFIVPSGYSNSGSATGCAVVATGTTPTTTTTTTSAKSYDIDWQVVGQGNGFKEAELQLFKNGASVVTQVITNGTPSVQGLFSSSNGDVISAKLTTKNLTSEETQVQNGFSLIGAGGLQELDTGILQPPAGGVTYSLATNFSTEYTQPGINNGPLLLFKVNQEQIASSEITMSLTNNGANFNFEIEDNDQSGDPVVLSIPTNGPIWNGNYYYDFLVGREYTVTFPYSNNEPGGVSTELVISGGGITPFSDQVDNPSGSVNTITHTFTVLNATSIVIEAFEY